jgi:hypothetical protein
LNERHAGSPAATSGPTALPLSCSVGSTTRRRVQRGLFRNFAEVTKVSLYPVYYYYPWVYMLPVLPYLSMSPVFLLVILASLILLARRAEACNLAPDPVFGRPNCTIQTWKGC